MRNGPSFRPGLARPALAAALLIGTIAASLAPATSAAATTCPTTEWHRIQGWVHKCGMELVDGVGHLVRPLATSIFTMSHDTGRNPSRCLHYQPPLAGAAANYQNWGLSAVLLYISWANVEPTPPTTVNGTLVHHYNATYLKAVDAVVQSFASHGVKVILDMANDRWSSAFTNLTLPSGINVSCGSGMPAWLYSNSWIAAHGGGLAAMVAAEKQFLNSPSSDRIQAWFAKAWAKVIQRYATNRAVIGAVILHEAYDILAARYPGTTGLVPGDLRLARLYERVGAAIHPANGHVEIFMPDWHQWGGPAYALTRKPKVPNSVYSFEFYAPNWTTTGHNRMDTYWTRAVNWNVPAWVLEFYAYLPTTSSVSPSPTWASDTTSFLTYDKRRHIGWSYAPYSRLPHNPPALLNTLQAGY